MKLEDLNTDEEVIILSNYSYDDAIVGVTTDNRVVYDYDKMVEWLCENENFTEEDAIDWIEYNTIRALPYMGNRGPIIMHTT